MAGPVSISATSEGKVGTSAVVVLSVNTAPAALDDAFNVDQGIGRTWTFGAPGVLVNDRDGDNDVLNAVLVQNTPYGSVVLAADGSFSYTPLPDWTGTDSFSYEANDGAISSRIATVAIVVSGPHPRPTARCRDGTLSYSAHRSGTCSHHGGVGIWY
jgi:hypothetical protein